MNTEQRIPKGMTFTVSPEGVLHVHLDATQPEVINLALSILKVADSNARATALINKVKQP